MKTLKEQLAEYDIESDDVVFISVACPTDMPVAVSVIRLANYLNGHLVLKGTITAIYRPQPDGSLKPLEKKKKSWSEQLRERGAKAGDLASYKYSLEPVQKIDLGPADLTGRNDGFFNLAILLHLYRLSDDGRLLEVEK